MPVRASAMRAVRRGLVRWKADAATDGADRAPKQASFAEMKQASFEEVKQATFEEVAKDMAQEAPKERAAKGEKTLWEDYDTAKEIHQGNATEGFENVEVKPEHYAAAVRAFTYGTILAVVTVGALSFIGMRYAGFTSIDDLAKYMQAAPDRQAADAEARGEKVIRHEINLLEPGSWSSSWEAILKDLEKLEEAKKAEATVGAAKSA
eukprot:TRINITY_DN14503_c0_g1_i1.p1 TRINITY_DN14503_c0_g1~~TRINITY_DN14503_c0_g1_i1.p1  ORF type:complete len:226 (+),score=85.51 TRINITY_DN14503_c0_g1_i1:60-680(+)